MTYYLKYRPQTIDQLDLKEVRDTLTKIIRSQNIPHAFLLSGPKGTGKTSAARLIAKVVNCENRRKNSIDPCNKCAQCKTITQGNNIDVIEMDAASNRGIDDIRALRDAVKLSSANALKKVYIIDEAHMLTTEASNALLKTLEEPPDHVIFILATTNPEKLIETIRSRSVNIVFRKANVREIIRSLSRVVKGEKLKITEDTLELIAKASDGSFRDATKILEQIVTELKSFQKEDIENYLFGKVSSSTNTILDALYKKDVTKALEEVEKAYDTGIDMLNLSQDLISKLRENLMFRLGIKSDASFQKFEKHETIDLIELLMRACIDIPLSVMEQIPLELAFIKWCLGSGDMDNNNVEEDNTKNNEKFGETIKVQTKETEVKSLGELKNGNGVTEELWHEVLSRVKPINTSTEALLRATAPVEYDGKTLKLAVFYSFHKERLENKQHRQLLEDVVMQVMGTPVRVVCTLTKPPEKQIVKETVLVEPEPTVKEEESDIVKIAEEIFGS